MNITIIAAIDEAGAIGKNGDQLAYVSADLKRFKQLTSGYPVVMGRKTLEALKGIPLPNRRNIVMSRDKTFEIPGFEVVSSPAAVLKLCANHHTLFVIGGGEIYRLFMPIANNLLVTVIHEKFEHADTWFPEIDPVRWAITGEEGPFVDQKTGLAYTFKNYQRSGEPAGLPLIN